MNFQKIYECDLANGPGIRISLFVSGCTLHCEGCFNQEAWDFKSGQKFTEKHLEAIAEKLKSSEYDGLSILGGEPFDQSDEDLRLLQKLCKIAKKNNKNVWIWTGHYMEELKRKEQIKLIKSADTIVYGRFDINKKKKMPYFGSTNQSIVNIRRK